MALYQVFLESLHIPYRQFGVVNNVKLEHKKEGNEVFYRKKLVDDLIFMQKDDYDEIFALSPYENEEVTVTIKVDCDGTFTEKWKGTFTIVDCKVDRDNCEIRVKPKVLDKYSCFLSKIKNELNFWDEPEFVSVDLYGVDEDYIYLQHEILLNIEVFTNTAPFPPVTYSGTTWWWDGDAKTTKLFPNPDPFTGGWLMTAGFQHIVGFGTDTTPPDNSGLWEKWKNVKEHPSEPDLPFVGAWYWVRNPLIGVGGIASLGKSKKFIKTVEKSFEKLNCTSQIKSIFFNYKPYDAAPGNLAYLFANNNCKNVTICQKSDVKRPYVTPSTEEAWKYKVENLLNDLKVLFNVYWDIDENNNIVFEHISYFTYGIIDISNVANALNKKYEYRNEDAIKIDRFGFMDKKASKYFVGSDIQYLLNEGEIKENNCTMFDTDVYYVQESVNAENIQDSGFVICSNILKNGAYSLKKSNTPFSFTELHANLHRHNRPYQEFYINSFLDSALSKIKTKQQDEFFVFICCDSIKDNSGTSVAFDPKKLYTTILGDGEIETAIHDLTRDTLTLKLNY